MIDDKTKAWTAGFFDGEGSALIEKVREDTYQITVCVSTTNQRVSEEIMHLWGGRYNKSRDMSKYYNTTKTNYTVIFDRGEAKKFLTDIYPYLRLKQEEVIIVLRALLAAPRQGKYGTKIRRAPRGSLQRLKPYYEQLRKLRIDLHL